MNDIEKYFSIQRKAGRKFQTTDAVTSAELSGAEVIGLLVEETNSQAVDLYKSMGFKIVSFNDLSSDLRERVGKGKAVMLRKQP